MAFSLLALRIVVLLLLPLRLLLQPLLLVLNWYYLIAIERASASASFLSSSKAVPELIYCKLSNSCSGHGGFLSFMGSKIMKESIWSIMRLPCISVTLVDLSALTLVAKLSKIRRNEAVMLEERESSEEIFSLSIICSDMPLWPKEPPNFTRSLKSLSVSISLGTGLVSRMPL